MESRYVNARKSINKWKAPVYICNVLANVMVVSNHFVRACVCGGLCVCKCVMIQMRECLKINTELIQLDDDDESKSLGLVVTYLKSVHINWHLSTFGTFDPQPE